MHKRLIYIFIVGLLTLSSHTSLAETIGSGNYQIENPSIDGGGELSNSTNYSSRDSISDSSDSGIGSTNYKIFPGFMQHAYPGVPAAPTLTNTGGILYNALDFIIATGSGQQVDTTYAIAISSDDFATTYYIQSDDTVGSSEAWQTYSAWGSGGGQRVTGLSASTTYKIKVKARYGPDTETAFSSTTSATTSSPTLTVTFSGVNSGTSIAGQTTSVTTSANAIAFGSLTIGSPEVAAHAITVSTNASNGYTTTIQQNTDLTSTGNTISSVSATNTSPAAWPTGITTGRFGYHTTDSNLCTGSATRFSTNDTYAALATTAYEVACNTAPVTNEATTIVYKLEIGAEQAAGSYQNIITLITSAQY